MMTETNAKRLERLKKLGVEPMTTVWDMSESDLVWLIEQAERGQELEELLEGNEGMSVNEIRVQFVDLHRDYLGAKKENEQILDLLVEMRSTFDECDEKAEGHCMEDAIACPVAVAQYATNKFERTIEENKRLKRALNVVFAHAVESQADGTIDVITDTLQGLDFMETWNADCEKGKKLFKEWMK